MTDNPVKATQAHKKRRADQYNDPSHNYLKYWDERQYEHQSEQIAIKRLLSGKHFKHAADIGGGYGRLCLLLEDYADKVTLAEPSKQQLDIARDFLKDHPKIERKLMQADDLTFKDNSVDLVTMIRVMHHLPDPSYELREISRILSPDGYAIIEMANYLHMRNRLKYSTKFKKFPIRPVDIRSEEHKNADEIPFVNHNPYTFIRQLDHANLKIVDTLSVSNLRSTTLKKYLPREFMISTEKYLQKPLSGIYFGPSVFFLVKKK